MTSPEDSPSLRPAIGACPVCGGRLSQLPTVDGQGFLLVCQSCDYQALSPGPGDRQAERSLEPRLDDTQRFRRMLAEQAHSGQPADWPEELLEDLPAEARQALSGRQPTTEASRSDEEIPGHIKRTLMDYGFAIDEDARGLRLRSPGGLRRPGTGDLSSTDVIRLASQLGGAPPPPEERRTCPSCQAVVPRTASRCSWCDAELPPAPDA